MRTNGRCALAAPLPHRPERRCFPAPLVIPPERIQAVQAVRCVVCAGIREKKAGTCRQRGGIRQYLTGDNPVQQGGSYE